MSYTQTSFHKNNAFGFVHLFLYFVTSAITSVTLPDLVETHQRKRMVTPKKASFVLEIESLIDIFCRKMRRKAISQHVY